MALRAALAVIPVENSVTDPSGVIFTFAGFRSRWMIPFMCACCTASQFIHIGPDETDTLTRIPSALAGWGLHPAVLALALASGSAPARAPSASPTVRTRCTIAPLPDLNFGSMQTRRTNGSGWRSPRETKKPQGSVIVADGVRKDEEFSGTKEVEERHRINEASLDGWMGEHVEGYQGPLTVLQFKGGQSTPTYRIDSPSGRYVLRRKPFGQLKHFSKSKVTGQPAPFAACQQRCVFRS